MTQQAKQIENNTMKFSLISQMWNVLYQSQREPRWLDEVTDFAGIPPPERAGADRRQLIAFSH